MSRTRPTTIAILAVISLVGVACTSGDTAGPTESSGSPEPVTITVWDYYGKATPFQDSVIQGFETKYPWITVDHQGIGWDAARQKFAVTVSAGEPPDLATMDMTWLPTFASNGLFADLTELSGGQLNGEPIEDQYAQGALEAMTFDGSYVTMMFDFDVYSLYYRADLFKDKGIDVPGTWEEMQAAAKQLVEGDKYKFAVVPNDCFHWCQFLFQGGGSLLNEDNTQAAFDSEAGVAALDYQRSFLDDGTGAYWGTEEGDLMAGIKDGRIGMFQDGPYWMGLLKDGAPEMKGDWAIATAPYPTEPGSYLGGTGLSIPVNAAHPQEAWLFAQYMLELPQQIGVYTYAGAAPATTAALSSPALNEPDPYFGGQAPFPIFLDAMDTATHFPYVAQWSDIDTEIATMVESVMLGESEPELALSETAAKTNELLASG
jgi:ABC-type glycerol-3-phosphate transport system substrate-binding protein